KCVSYFRWRLPPAFPPTSVSPQMTIFDLFSIRQKRARGELPDVYEYNNLPGTLRVQVIHILRDFFLLPDDSISNASRELLIEIKDVLCREYGVFYLTEEYDDALKQICVFFLETKDIEKALDVVEICCRVAQKIIASDTLRYKPRGNVAEGIEELNH